MLSLSCRELGVYIVFAADKLFFLSMYVRVMMGDNVLLLMMIGQVSLLSLTIFGR